MYKSIPNNVWTSLFRWTDPPKKQVNFQLLIGVNIYDSVTPNVASIYQKTFGGATYFSGSLHTNITSDDLKISGNQDDPTISVQIILNGSDYEFQIKVNEPWFTPTSIKVYYYLYSLCESVVVIL